MREPTLKTAAASPVLARILRTNRVEDAHGVARPLLANMSAAEGELIIRVFEVVKPDISLEVGFGYAISTLFACAALDHNGKPARHIVIDPNQSKLYAGIGLLNVERAGYIRFVEHVDAGSELALPRLLEARTRIQAAIIDGWHTFDHALVDFFYVNKMIDVGGVVIFDDVNMPSIARLLGHLTTYPSYRVFDATEVRRAPNPLVALRRRWNGTGRSAIHARDNPSCIAVQKVAPDTRDWDWHADF
ncbi:MAG: class I SAM-dependent methyltransferase [Stellaceae bacterium]